MKKIVVAFVILFIITLIVVFGILFLKRGGVGNNFPSAVLPSEFANPETSSKVYQNSSFSMDYPVNWIAQEGFFKGGIEVVFKPQGLALQDFIPSIYITKFDSGSTDLIKQRQSPYEKTLHYVTSDGVLAGVSVIVSSGTLPSSVKNGQLDKTPVQDTTYYLLKDGALYEIRTRYTADSKQQVQENFFNMYLKTLNFN